MHVSLWLSRLRNTGSILTPWCQSITLAYFDHLFQRLATRRQWGFWKGENIPCLGDGVYISPRGWTVYIYSGMDSIFPLGNGLYISPPPDGKYIDPRGESSRSNLISSRIGEKRTTPIVVWLSGKREMDFWLFNWTSVGIAAVECLPSWLTRGWNHDIPGIYIPLAKSRMKARSHYQHALSSFLPIHLKTNK